MDCMFTDVVQSSLDNIYQITYTLSVTYTRHWLLHCYNDSVVHQHFGPQYFQSCTNNSEWRVASRVVENRPILKLNHAFSQLKTKSCPFSLVNTTSKVIYNYSCPFTHTKIIQITTHCTYYYLKTMIHFTGTKLGLHHIVIRKKLPLIVTYSQAGRKSSNVSLSLLCATT